MPVLAVTEKSFDREVVASRLPVLVEFWASWCGPCGALAQVLDGVVLSHDGRLKVCKINVDENPKLAKKFGVRGVPALALFLGGNLLALKVGALDLSKVTAFLGSNL
jgi:thioredoxin 1